MKTRTNNRSIVDLDLVGYSEKIAISATTGPGVDRDVRKKIDELVGLAFKSLNNMPDERGRLEKGDGGQFTFVEAVDAHKFAVGIHEACLRSNDSKPSDVAEFWFRIGIATGTVECDAGFPKTLAARLQASGSPGAIMICEDTYNALPEAVQEIYSSPVEITSKHASERIFSRRCVVANLKSQQTRDHISATWYCYHLTQDALNGPDPYWAKGTITLTGEKSEIDGQHYDLESPRNQYQIRGRISEGAIIALELNIRESRSDNCLAYFNNLQRDDVILGFWMGPSINGEPTAGPYILSRKELQLKELLRLEKSNPLQYLEATNETDFGPED